MASGSQQLLTLLVLASVAVNAVHGCGINIVNSCSYMVTTCAQDGQTAIAQYNLQSGQSQFLDFGSGCTWISGAIWASVGGQCAVSGNPSAAKDRNLADLAEFNIESPTDFYDLSNVDAYTIGLSITGPGTCASRTCTISDIRSFCQSPNVLVTEPTGALVCKNTDGGGSSPTPGTIQFHNACPEAFSYSTDTSVQRTCANGSNYQVTFCPLGAGGAFSLDGGGVLAAGR